MTGSSICVFLHFVYFFSARAVHSPLLASANDTAVPKKPPKINFAVSTKPPLCDAKIVDNVCSMLSSQISGGGKKAPAATGNKMVFAAAISDWFGVNRKSLTKFFKANRIVNRVKDPALLKQQAYGVDCAELCNKTLQALPFQDLPKTSDMGCIRSKASVVCNTNMSPEFLKNLKKQGKSKAEVDAAGNPETGAKHRASGPKWKGRGKFNLTKMANKNLPTIKSNLVANLILNLFRIYPATDVDFRVKKGADLPGDPEEETKTKDGVLSITVLSTAVLTLALRNLAAGAGDSVLQTWFGSSDESTRTKARGIIASLYQVLSSVEFVYPGEKCDATTVAYVVGKPPKKARNAKKQHIFKLCNHFFEISIVERVNSILHEASHHVPVLAKDISYGIDKTKKLAKTSPEKAITNAESICYFISSICQVKTQTTALTRTEQAKRDWEKKYGKVKTARQLKNQLGRLLKHAKALDKRNEKSAAKIQKTQKGSPEPSPFAAAVPQKRGFEMQPPVQGLAGS
eukprot:TRINITY_DN54756_c0_g1_i1.p1 TRINITY_DN54756_c0_g1~~TRINITY_DN54756_c0_g1_i1.p1  ORF type:complete len:515 (+),score=69.75 TRINITY_DN54756_c0_g1_i1:43-1587(+)